MWEPFETHGELKGRVRGVSLPAAGRAGQIVAWTDAGLFALWHFRSLSITKLATLAQAARAFDRDTGLLWLRSVAYPMYGACGPSGERYTPEVSTEHPAGDHLEPDPATDSLLVLDHEGTVRQAIPNYRPAAVPWSVAAFAGDQSVLVLADPHGVRVYKYVVEKGAEKPLWTGGPDAAQHKHLLRAILDNPDEDTPRLMYADWLDENRDPLRAEFIRLQCRYAERLRERPHPETTPDVTRMWAIDRQMRSRWLAELPAVRGVHWGGFERGFPTVQTGSPTTLVRAAGKVWAAAPVQTATFTELTPTGARTLGESEWLERLRQVTVEGYYVPREDGTALIELLDTPHAARLRSVTLTSCSVSEKVVAALARSPHLNGLEWLRTSYGVIDEAGLRVLLAAPQLKKLKGGPFHGSDIPPELRGALRERYPFA